MEARLLDVSTQPLVSSCDAGATYSTDVKAIAFRSLPNMPSNEPVSSNFFIIFFISLPHVGLQPFFSYPLLFRSSTELLPHSHRSSETVSQAERDSWENHGEILRRNMRETMSQVKGLWSTYQGTGGLDYFHQKAKNNFEQRFLE